MSTKEQDQYSEEIVTSLKVACEVKEAGQHNCQVAAFNDARAIVGHLQREIINVNQQTGMEFMLVAVRKDIKQFNAPYVFRTLDLFDSFFHNTTKFTLADLVLKLECFFIGGIDGVSQNYIQRLVQLKSRTTAIIKDKLKWYSPLVKLNDNKYEQWRTQHLEHHAAAQVALSQITSDGNGESSHVPIVNNIPLPVVTNIPAVNSENGVTNAPVASKSSPAAAPILTPSPTFMNFGMDGVVIPTKTCKQRKDKGVLRGPRKGK
ncbi:hypothetical protein H1R20_g13372, partial [Candolleomyces eurysporus]